MGLKFKLLNEGWNAEPNSPSPHVSSHGSEVVLSFWVNAFCYHDVREEDRGVLRFDSCSRHRLGPTNDEGWYQGQCQYTTRAPRWGGFYDVVGYDPLKLIPVDWTILGPDEARSRHALFYLRDQTFECLAASWHYHVEHR